MTESPHEPLGRPDLPDERTCANCACAARMTRKGELLALDTVDPDSFLVCRRNMPQASQTTNRLPRLDPVTREHMRTAERQPMYDTVTAVQIGYPASLPVATCYDGWRPLGTLPGERWDTSRMMRAFRPMLEKALIATGLAKKQAEEMGRAMLTGLMRDP